MRRAMFNLGLIFSFFWSLNYPPSSKTQHTFSTNFLHMEISLTTLSLSLWTSPHSTLISLTLKAFRLLGNTSTKHSTQSPPTETICDLVNIILQNNNFEFDGQFFLQKHGTAMGTRMAPPYANLFMGSLEATALKNAPCRPLVWCILYVKTRR